MGKSSSVGTVEFLKTIFGPIKNGLIELRAIPLREASSASPTRLWTKSPKEIEAFVEKFGKKGSQYGVYFGVCKRSHKGGKKQDVLGATCLWADIDCVSNGQSIDGTLALIGQMPSNIQPSIVVHSGGGLHLYWLLDRVYTFEPSRFDDQSMGWIETANVAMGELVGGDNVHDVTRVMRIPGSFNNKRRPEKECKVIYCAHHLKYDLRTLLEAVGRWGKVIDGNKWVSAKVVAKKESDAAPTDEVDALHKFERAHRAGRAKATLDRFWRDRVRHHAPRGYVGIHEAIVISTARLHCTKEFTPDRIVEKVVGWIKQVPDIDASQWDWEAEKKKIRNALETWGPKWQQIKKDERRNGQPRKVR